MRRAPDPDAHAEAVPDKGGAIINPNIPPHGPTAYSDTGEYDDAADQHRVPYGGGFTLVYDDAEHSHIPTVEHVCPGKPATDNAGYFTVKERPGRIWFACYQCSWAEWRSVSYRVLPLRTDDEPVGDSSDH